MDILIVIDMQNDFITGSLGSVQAQSILPNVIEKIKNFDGKILFTMDTHSKNYLSTQEGKKLPIEHCIRDTHGWRLHETLAEFASHEPITKDSFGSVDLATAVKKYDTEKSPLKSITLIGLCTDICVISNAFILKGFFPEVPIIVDALCCAGVTPESHKQALSTMKNCQIEIINA